MCFDLLDKGFKTINLLHNDKVFELKLGENDWIANDIRRAHNLYKLVMLYIINK